MEDAKHLIEAASQFVAAASVLMLAVNRMLSNAPPQWRAWVDPISRVLNFLAVNSQPAHTKDDKPL